MRKNTARLPLMVILTAWVSMGAFGEEPGTSTHFVRSCLVFSEPSLKASNVCKKKAGEKISYSDSAPGGFVQVEMEDCAGYVPDTCVAGPMLAEKTGVKRTPPHRRFLFRMGLGASFDGTLASVTGNSALSRGDGWSFNARFDIALNDRFYLSILPQLQTLGLTRSLAATGGALVDPSPSSFNQRVKFYGVQALLGIVVHRKFSDANPITDPEISLEGGLQYLIPYEAIQTDSTGTKIAFAATDRPLLLVVGPTLDISWNSSFSTLFHGQFFYNVGGGSGSRFFGGRVAIALMAGLL